MKAENLIFSELHKSRILVVGDVMLDRYWYGEVERISDEAPVQIVKIESKRTRETPGGAANVAANAAALGANVALLSVVGDDEPPTDMYPTVLYHPWSEGPAQYWDVMPDAQTEQNAPACVLQFLESAPA